MERAYGVAIASIYLEKLKYHVFPIRQILGITTGEPRCDCTDETCPNVGKHPRVAWSKNTATASAWERWPNDGFGIATGARSGIWVLDVDPKNNGPETLRVLEQAPGHAPLPRTITVKTGSGGEHYYFRYPGPNYRNTAGALGLGLDTRGDGGFVVGPGSLHKSGRRYTWKHGPADAPLADPPEWLLKLVKQTAKYRRDVNVEKQGLHTAPVPRAEAEYLLEIMLDPDCRLTQWMRTSPDDVSRETWRGFATNLACAVVDHPELIEKACEAFHEISSGYSRYKVSETERVFRDSVTVARVYGPMSFEHMVRSGMPSEHAIPPHAKNLLHSAQLEMRRKRPRKSD
jgi:hypothetical protein